MMWRPVMLVLLGLATPLAAQEDAAPLDGNAEMAAIYAADQAARSGSDKDWEAIRKADRQRRERVRALLDEGALQTGADFHAAAFVFQHGDEPEDYLLAHALAVRSLGLGFKRAEWIAAATLDRYLQSIARDQIYGTQSLQFIGEPATRGRYDRTLLTDQLRVGAGVETLAEQDAILEERNAQTDHAHDHE